MAFFSSLSLKRFAESYHCVSINPSLAISVDNIFDIINSRIPLKMNGIFHRRTKRTSGEIDKAFKSVIEPRDTKLRRSPHEAEASEVEARGQVEVVSKGRTQVQRIAAPGAAAHHAVGARRRLRVR